MHAQKKETNKEKEALMNNNVKKDFVNCFISQVSTNDKLDIGENTLEQMASDFYEWGSQRNKSHNKIRVYNTDNEHHVWKADNTVIEIINNDRPFLIDSIASELAHYNFSISFLFHPVIGVKRNNKGKIESISADMEEARLNGALESCIHIQLEQRLPDDVCKGLAETLSNIVDDVCVATDDWHEMLDNLQGAIRGVSKPSLKICENERAEAIDFLDYIYKNNFTFLGYRKYNFKKSSASDMDCSVAKSSELGLLKDGRHVLDCMTLQREYEMLSSTSEPVVVSKWINEYSTVHRRVPFDVINVKIFDKSGAIIGQHVFVGLFTSSTYSCRTLDVPLVRQKVKDTLDKTRLGHDSHDRKALEHILEKYPRDELFQLSVDELVETSLGILQLQERQNIAFFARKDPLERYVSCLVYVPRDIYDTRFRKNVEAILEKHLDGVCTNFYTTLDDSPLARVLFTVLIETPPIVEFDADEIEKELIEVGRSWAEKLRSVLILEYGKDKGVVYAHDYIDAFPISYQDAFGVIGAVKDIKHIQLLIDSKEDDIAVDFFQPVNAASKNEYHLRVYHKHDPVRLSDILTVLDHMGLESVSEMPFSIKPNSLKDISSVWVHDFIVYAGDSVSFKLEDVKENFERAFFRIWQRMAEDDELNALILQAGLTWREVWIVRSYTSYLKQARFPYSRGYIETVLSSHSDIVRDLVGMYKTRHKPDLSEKERKIKIDEYEKNLEQKLNDVSILDHDHILRAYWTLIKNTLRTNYYQEDEDGERRLCLSFKLDSKNIDFVPKPRPHVEIFVYSSRLEAVHLRGGEIARGGIRWSDRIDDFRTEILGLVKSQMVKNAVIVPVGSKGGFILKNPPKEGGREAFMEEGIACYKLFVQSLLDLTDNNVKGVIVPPENTVRYDEDDTYLVVAADKGTATFSDIANDLSQGAGFWLDDAFASGGSVGYDHKAMGITARGAWDSVKRHFREMGKDTQKEEFTVIGVGDMGGDVFGNGMLLSKHICMQGAFNHVHIFCDPNPDALVSFKERERLFEARGGWDQYDVKKLSKGGCVYDRSAKSLKITPEIKQCFGLKKDKVTPNELMSAMLKSEVELIWFGGIGTYIKHSQESNADADDRNNDALRVDASEVYAKVIGEGANLGMTQKGRIEFAQRGGRLNTDFIDNSAGVDCSDHEVNIKILLSSVEQDAKHKMSRKSRNALLESMTDEVAELVLQDNYQQTQALSVALFRAPAQLPLYAGLIRDLEQISLLDRKIENLPSHEDIGRMLQDRQGLSRPELSIILSYVKIKLFKDLLDSDLPDEPEMEEILFNYFPVPVQKYKKEIKAHGLRREIIATVLANTVVNRMGPVFLKSRAEKTGASSVDVVKAFLIMSGAFNINKLWSGIEGLDGKVDSSVQTKALNDVYTLLKHITTWMLRRPSPMGAIKDEVMALSSGAKKLSGLIEDLIPHYVKGRSEERRQAFVLEGMPESLAREIAYAPVLDAIPDIVEIGSHCNGPLQNTAAVYFGVGQSLRLGWLRQQCAHMNTENHWQSRALSGLVDDFYNYQAVIARGVIDTCGCPTSTKNPLEEWKKRNKDKFFHVEQLISEIDRAAVLDVSMLTLAGQTIRQFIT